MAQAHQRVPLWGLFLALLVLTAAEVAMFEIWSHNPSIMPKFVMVLVLLFVLTLPKALIVLTYFMHLKFERQIIVTLAMIPFGMVFIAVLPILTDIVTLEPQAYNQVPGLRDYGPAGHDGHNTDGNHHQTDHNHAGDSHGAHPHDEAPADEAH